MRDALWQYSATDLREMIQSRQVSAVEVCEALINRIESVEGRSGGLVQQEDEIDSGKKNNCKYCK